MKEALFILVIVFALFVWTAFRYRKQIAGLVGFARMIKEPKQQIGQSNRPGREKEQRLVGCSNCGIFVPRDRARTLGDRSFCSDECLAEA